MKSKVLKYLIPFAENFTLDLPKGSKIVRIDVDQGNPYLWALVNIDEAEIKNSFCVVHTLSAPLFKVITSFSVS